MVIMADKNKIVNNSHGQISYFIRDLLVRVFHENKQPCISCLDFLAQ